MKRMIIHWFSLEFMLVLTMLKTFLECEEVKAVVSIGCCYNLLLKKGVRSAGFPLGKSYRDLACQSAERWRSLEKDAGLHNFEFHSFRAAFQMVLCKYYPEVVGTSPSIRRQGKALRRRQQRKVEAPLHHKEITHPCLHSNMEGSCPDIGPTEPETVSPNTTRGNNVRTALKKGNMRRTGLQL